MQESQMNETVEWEGVKLVFEYSLHAKKTPR